MSVIRTRVRLSLKIRIIGVRRDISHTECEVKWKEKCERMCQDIGDSILESGRCSSESRGVLRDKIEINLILEALAAGLSEQEC